MNRILTITLLGLLLFNWCGYQMLNAWLENRATDKLQQQLENNQYDQTKLITIKVPATYLTYYNYSEKFESVQGQIEIGGMQYRFVKRRLFNDSIEMLCIPNAEAMHYKKANYDYFKLVYDLQRPGGKRTGSHSFKRFTSIYCTVNELYQIENVYFSLRSINSRYTAALPANSAFIVERPPERVS